MKSLAVRLILAAALLYQSWLETKAPYTTIIIGVIIIGNEILGTILTIISKQVSHLQKVVNELLEK